LPQPRCSQILRASAHTHTVYLREWGLSVNEIKLKQSVGELGKSRGQDVERHKLAQGFVKFIVDIIMRQFLRHTATLLDVLQLMRLLLQQHPGSSSCNMRALLVCWSWQFCISRFTLAKSLSKCEKSNKVAKKNTGVSN